MIGKKLAHYEVTAHLGSGGMGDVYRASDTKLSRDVALKILPEVFARDPERVTRFGREAKVLAALNHPNIATIYGLEESGGTHFLVLELVEGETLAERLGLGPIPAPEALHIARQIAEAIEAAHEKGVVHRDLKPANIKITPDGKVKVLDFGLAKAFASERGENLLSNSPTISISATHSGVILGTAAYMSPEQAKGTAPVDKRADLFSFGCILYEMLSGRRTFQGESLTEVLAGVLAREPDLNLIPSKLNPRITNLVRRCLEKDVKKRWQGIGDLRVEIESILADPQGLEIKVAASKPQPLWKTAVWVLSGILAGAAIVLSVFHFRPAASAKVVRFSFVLPERQAFSRTGREIVAISPDSTNVVYVAGGQLYVKALSELSSHPIPGTAQDVVNPVFSPEGQWVAYYAAMDGTLKKIALSGGAPVTLSKMDFPSGLAWGSGKIFVGHGAKGIDELPDTGGVPKSVITVKPGEVAENPDVLPGGKEILYTVTKATGQNRLEQAQIVVQSLAGGDPKVLISGGAARYVSTGHIVYALGTTLFAQRFDLKSLTLSGGPVSILEGVMRAGVATTAAQFAFSQDGAMVYVPSVAGEGSGERSLGIIDHGGVVKMLPLPLKTYDHPRVSPDGTQLVFQTNDDGGTIWIYPLSGNASMRKLTFEGANSFPIWSRDGKSVTFESIRDGKGGIFTKLADGTGVAQGLTTLGAGETEHRPRSWLRDGKTLAFSMLRKNDWGIWTIVPGNGNKPEVLIDLPDSAQSQPAFSPDGQWLAYSSTETSDRRIYVEAYPRTGAGKYQVSKEGGADMPMWSPDGNTLYYFKSSPNQFVAVRILQKQPSFSFSEPEVLPIDASIQAQTANYRRYDVIPDGRFLVLLPPSQGAAVRPTLEIHVVLNWFEELKQRAPGL
jgi:serine/threonine-protein kinase